MRQILLYALLLLSLGINAQSSIQYSFYIQSEAPLNVIQQDTLEAALLRRIEWLGLDSIEVAVEATQVLIKDDGLLSEKERILLVASSNSCALALPFIPTKIVDLGKNKAVSKCSNIPDTIISSLLNSPHPAPNAQLSEPKSLENPLR